MATSISRWQVQRVTSPLNTGVCRIPTEPHGLPGERYEYDADKDRLVRVVTRSDGREVASYLPGSGLEIGETTDLARLYDQTWLRSRVMPLVTHGAPEIRVADLFSGCGGMTLGVVEAARALGMKCRPILAVDSNPVAIDVYRKNLNPEIVRSTDINDLLDGELGEAPTTAERELISALRGEIDLVVAGPPCQGHSDLNNRTRRDDPKNRLIFKVARFVELTRPRHVIVENVQGIIHDKNGVFQRTRDYLQYGLSEFGYSVIDGIVEANRLGVAQHRRRVLLVASREKNFTSLQDLIAPFETAEREFGWACGDLVNSVEGVSGFDSASIPTEVTRKRIEFLFKHGFHNLPNSERPSCHRDKAHTYDSVYGRMWMDRPAPTITTGFTSMGQGRFVHPTRPRTITPHEAARLQFFPDFFDFGQRTRTEYKMLIGNAVPPKLIFVLALQLFR